MIRTAHPGLYVDALPNGEFCVLVPGVHVLTHLGPVPFWPGETYGPMFLACTTVPEFKFTGLAHDSAGRQLEWSESRGWRDVPFLTGRTAYDQFGNVRDLAPAGVQFVTEAGIPVSRVDTYGPFHGLSEWVEVGGLYLGQGHTTSGVRVWDGTVLRSLDEGYCVFVRAHRDGARVTVSYVKGGEGAVIVQTSLAELRTRPVVASPDPDPAPNPEPEPMAEYPLPRTVYDLVLRMAEKFPALRMGDDDDRRAFTLKVAQQVRFVMGPWWGTKRAGPTRPLSKDAIAFEDDDQQILIAWDLINGSTREVHPHPIMGEDITGQVFEPVVPIDHLGLPAPTDPPPAGPDDAAVAALRAQLEAATTRLAALERRLTQPRRVALRAYSGLYVSADHDRGEFLVADRLHLGAWEVFEVIDQ